MKKCVCFLLAMVLMFSLCACGNSSSAGDIPASNTSETSSTGASTGEPETSPDTAPADTVADASEDDSIDDPAWNELESLGKIETENGLFYVSITMPADFVGSDITQESIDAKAGETYTSGKLNADGSVTYKMTKKQHKAMLDTIAKGIDDGLQQMVDSPDYAFTKISHNDDFTVFDAYLSTEQVGFTEGFMAMGFYMYGGMYALFTGKEVDNIAVNYYSPSGNLISTANSSEMGG